MVAPSKHREYERQYRANNREKIRAKAREPASREKKNETRRKWRAENKEAHLAYNRAWRLANHDKAIASTQRYRDTHREEIGIYRRKYLDEHRAQYLECYKAYRLRRKSINAIRHDPDTVYRVVSRAVSSALPRFMRDDVINSMLLAVLEGELLLENIGARMKEYLGRYNREYDTFKTLSLDAPMGGTDLKRIDLLVAPDADEPEEDEEDPDMVMLRGGHSRW